MIGGTGKGKGGGGSKYGLYAGQVQSRVADALRGHKKTRSASMSVKVRIWVDSTGRITNAKLSGSSGDAAVDRAICDEILTGLQLQSPPPEGMPMPRWVFFDCSEMPGAIYGLARPARTLWPKARELFKVPHDYDGLVPVSMYVAIPMYRPGIWFGHNLSSLAPVFERAGVTDTDLRGLGSLTKGLALKCFGVQEFWGATQWLSKALYIHVKFGPLDLQTAFTPAHSEHETLTYGFRVTDDSLRASMGDPGIRITRPQPTFWLEGHDVPGMQTLQDRIEAGERYVIPDAPRATPDGGVLVPITRVA